MHTGFNVADLTLLLAQQVAEQSLSLPMLPAVANEVLALTQTETTDAARLSQVMHRDPALASNVLRVANSAAFVGQVPCASLQQAVSRLGLQRVTEIALALAVKGSVFGKKRHAQLFAGIWKHSVVTAFFTKEIARTRRRNVEISFMCGLLHDLGQAVLLSTAEQLLPNETFTAADLSGGLHAQHGAAGALLGRHWALPEQIVEAIEHHHDFSKATKFQEMAMTVCLADLLAHLVADPDAPAPKTSESLRQHPVLQGLNLYQDQLDALLGKAPMALLAAEGMQ
ncbi:MAG: HDOD domain-containing protein [Planctomycetota bacterium]|nr:HDOD domain-containing protein [Planctomycetota bacterium]